MLKANEKTSAISESVLQADAKSSYNEVVKLFNHCTTPIFPAVVHPFLVAS